MLKENSILHGNVLRINEKMYQPDIPLIPCCFVVRWVVSKSEAGEPLVDAHAHLQWKVIINEEAYQMFSTSK